MKKIEIYLSDNEYNEIINKIQKYQNEVKYHQDDGVYTDEERAAIINAFGSLPFYVSKGLKKQVEDMDEYIGRYRKKDKKQFNQNSNNQPQMNQKKEQPQVETKAVKVNENKETEDLKVPEEVNYKTEVGDSSDFDFNA